MGILVNTRLVRGETRISQRRASFLSSRRLLDSHRRDKMINRPRTAFVSIAAVAVSMIVLGTNARAKSVPAASPQNYMGSSAGCPPLKTGMSLTQTIMSQETSRDGLKEIPAPGPRQVQTNGHSLQSGDECLFSDSDKHQCTCSGPGTSDKQYLALEAQKERCIAAGRINQARRVREGGGQVFSVMNSLPDSFRTERGVATPTR